MAILAVLLIIVGTIMMAMSQKAGAMAAQVRKGTIHAVLCQNLCCAPAFYYAVFYTVLYCMCHLVFIIFMYYQFL